MPKAIREISAMIPDEISKSYEKYPFERYGIPYLHKILNKYGIGKNKAAFDECFDTAMMGYMYSVHRCAYMRYNHTENYIKHMIKCCIKIGLVLANKDMYAMRGENYKRVYLDDEKNLNRF